VLVSCNGVNLIGNQCGGLPTQRRFVEGSAQLYNICREEETQCGAFNGLPKLIEVFYFVVVAPIVFVFLFGECVNIFNEQSVYYLRREDGPVFRRAYIEHNSARLALVM
jgi:hypothetical protein